MDEKIITISVAVRYFWGGSAFYSGNLDHCIALPLEEVPELMKLSLKEEVVPHFRFSSVPNAGVKDTVGTLPGYVVAKGNVPQWYVAYLCYDPNIGFWFKEYEILVYEPKYLLGRISGFHARDEPIEQCYELPPADRYAHTLAGKKGSVEITKKDFENLYKFIDVHSPKGEIDD